jgi:DNA-binding CsgD family transcriptional regulator
VLFGRERELARVAAALSVAREGTSRVLLVRGPAGIGKSALLAQVRDRAAGMQVLEARGVEAESELAFAGLSELLGPLVELAAGLPAAQTAAVRGALALGPAQAADRFAVGVGTLGLLTATTEELPLLVLVEDLHWLDAASAEALAFAARRLRAEPIALLVSCRDEPTAFDAGGFEQLVLGGLDAAAAAGLLAERAGQPVASGVVDRLVAATEGNPLALGELASVLTPSQLSGRTLLPDPLPAHASAERLFADRIGVLNREERRALLLAAAAGEGEAAPVLAAADAAGLDKSVFEGVEAAGIIVLADGRLGFSHPLVRSAVYAAVGPDERRAAHRALAESFSDDRRAWHLAAAALGADEGAAAALERAAERASRRGGFAASAAALERAARLSPDPSHRARRLLAAADAARLAGHPEHALELLDDAADPRLDDAELQVRCMESRARVERVAGRVRDAWRHYVRAAELCEKRDPQLAANALAHAALAALLAGEHEQAVATAAKAHAALDEHSAQAERSIAGLILGAALWRFGRTAEGLSLVMPAAELAERPHRDEPELAAFAALMLALVGEHKRAEAILERLIREARVAGALGVLPFALFVTAQNDAWRGRWAAAYATAAEAVELADETGSRLWQCLALNPLVIVEGGQGRDQACRAHAREALSLADRFGIEFLRDVHDTLGLLELVRGDLDRAIETLERTAGLPGDQRRLPLRPSTPDLVEAYVRTGDPRAGRLAQLASEHVDALEIPWLAGLAARCRGLVAPDDAFDCDFDAALRLFDAAPFEQARTALNYGERLRRAGRRRDARAQLHAALELFNRLGAAPWAERTEKELRATGERLRRRDPSAAEQLTAQELQIALTVAGGATNREAGAALFLSHKTIERHLSQVYRKLGLRSRSELARALGDQVAHTSASRRDSLSRA